MPPEQPLNTLGSRPAEILRGKLQAALMVLLCSSQAVRRARQTFRTCVQELLSNAVGLCWSWWHHQSFKYTLHMKYTLYFTRFSPADFIYFLHFHKIRMCRIQNSFAGKWQTILLLCVPSHRVSEVFLKLECRLHTKSTNCTNNQCLLRSNPEVTF